MWNLISHFLTFAGGMASGVMLMCLILTGKLADKEFETMKKKKKLKLVIAEKPSVAMSLAAVLGATERKDGYLEGSGYLVSWCVGHLLELAQPEAYKEQYAKWRYEDLPILPENWKRRFRFRWRLHHPA